MNVRMNEFQAPWKTGYIFLPCTRIKKLTILETSEYILKIGISFDFFNRFLIYIIVLQPFWREKNNIPKQSVMKQH